MITEFSDPICKAVRVAEKASATGATSREALDCMDATSLSGKETAAEIGALCQTASKYAVASVCIYPPYVAQARSFLPEASPVRVATVINFPSGRARTLGEKRATPETVRADVKAAIADGANQIDIVLAHDEFRAGDRDYAEELLRACREACGQDAKMLVILESAAFEREDDLRDACRLALACGTDGLKTSTGKHLSGGAQLETGAILLDEAARSGREVLVKISGGVKTPDDCARFLALAHQFKGPQAMTPDRFRIGASSVLPELVRSWENSRPGGRPGFPPAFCL